MTSKTADPVADKSPDSASETLGFYPDLSRAFATNLALALYSLNASSGVSGHKREHEVGNRTRYDDIDDCQSGTKLTM